MIENKKKLIFCDSCQTVMKITRFNNSEERIKLTEKVNQIIIDNPEIMEKKDKGEINDFKFYSGPSLEYESWSCNCPKSVITIEQTIKYE